MLYQWDMSREPMEKVSGLFWQVRSATDEARAMAERLARGAQSEVETLDAAIAAALTNWPFDRLAAVDRNIMRIAAYELAREPQTPAAVVIDEAVEMARRFGEKDSPAFVNGVLDAVKRALREDGAARARPRGGEKP
jgi:N utilization substance protein B